MSASQKKQDLVRHLTSIFNQDPCPHCAGQVLVNDDASVECEHFPDGCDFALVPELGE